MHTPTRSDYRPWLAALPTSANAEHGILACHGTPTGDNQYLVEEISDADSCEQVWLRSRSDWVLCRPA